MNSGFEVVDFFALGFVFGLELDDVFFEEVVEGVGGDDDGVEGVGVFAEVAAVALARGMGW